MNRRQFLSTVAASAPLFVSARALGREGPAPSETVNVGMIGLGGRAREMAKTIGTMDGSVRIRAICDIHQPSVDEWMAAMPTSERWTPYLDFRTMIEQENLDGVLVETTTHARAWITCHAMAMGCDAYIEKPASLSIAEGREMVDCARKYDRVTQVGTQQRSIPLNNWASDLVQQGAIGNVHTVLAPNFMGPHTWEGGRAQPTPANDANPGWWDVWLNQTPWRPYHPELFHRWIMFEEYDGGGQSFGVTGWGTHSYDQMQRGLGTSETGPVELMLLEPVRDKRCGIYPRREIQDSETGRPYYDMVARHHGPRADVKLRYANGTEVLLTLDSDWGPGLGCIFIGDDGQIEVNRDMISGTPEVLDQARRPDALSIMETAPHIYDWADGIRTRRRCTADIEYGHRSTSLCYLVNIVRTLGDVGRTLHWDPDAEQFTNAPEANTMLARERRPGYELPA